MILRDFLTDQTGAAAAEYALILAIVGAGIAGAAFFLGSSISNAITGVGNTVASCTAANPPTC